MTAPTEAEAEEEVTAALEPVTGPDIAVIEDRRGWPSLPRWLGRARRALRPPPGPAPESTAVWVAVRALLALSLLGIWVLAYALSFSGVQETRNQAVLFADIREQLSGATLPFGGPVAHGGPVALLSVPSAGLRDVVVVEGTTSTDLTQGPGHLADTVMPGQIGVSVLLGRSVTFGAPFRSIGALRPGDAIDVTTGQGQFVYRVDRVRHKGDPLPAPLTGSQSRLTLVSATGSGWRTGWAPQQTVYVDATLHGGTAQLSPPGRPAYVADADQPMHGDRSSLVPLVLWLQAMLLTVVLAGAGRARWGRWQTWLVSVPVLLACLWGATQAAVSLLPNLV